MQTLSGSVKPSDAKTLLDIFDKIYPAAGGDTKAAATLRQEFSKETKAGGYPELRKQWENMKMAGETGAGDISIMYSYIKMLDPTTAVREGELALGDKAAGLPNNVVKTYNRLVSKKGAALSPELRKQYLQEGATIYNNVAKKQKELNAFYTGLATDSGADPKKVIGTIGEVNLAEIPQEKTTTEGSTNSGLSPQLETALNMVPAAAGVATGALAGAIPGVGQIPGVKGAIGGAGYASGQRLTDYLKGNAPEEASKWGLAGRLPTGGELATIGTSAAGEAALSGLYKLIKGGGLGGIRNARALQAGNEGVTIEGEKVAQAALDAAENAPTTYRPAAQRIAMQAIDKYAGKQLNPLQSILEKSQSWDAGYTANKAGKGASAYMERAIGNALKQELAGKAPGVSGIDKIFSTYFKGKQLGKNALWTGLKAAGLGRLLGL